jgi:hypothetical protein
MYSEVVVHTTSRYNDIPLRNAYHNNHIYGINHLDGPKLCLSSDHYSDNLRTNLRKTYSGYAMESKARKRLSEVAMAQLTGINGSHPVRSFVYTSVNIDGYHKLVLKLAKSLKIPCFDVSSRIDKIAKLTRKELLLISRKPSLMTAPDGIKFDPLF